MISLLGVITCDKLLERFSTFFGLKLAHHVFSQAEQVSTTIQGHDTSVQSVMNAVSLLRTFYQQLGNEEEFTKFHDHVVEEFEG